MEMEVCNAVTATGCPASALRITGHRVFDCTAQELEFIIHADGRVEERVRGVKGMDCQSVTAEINKALGEVIDSKPTQEMFEQKVTAGRLGPPPCHAGYLYTILTHTGCNRLAGRADGRYRKHSD